MISDATPKNCARFCHAAAILLDQSKIGLVDEGGRLQGVVPAALAEDRPPRGGRSSW